MEALEIALLYDYYGGMLTEKQSEYFDMRYNQDLSLGEIALVQGVSRQAVFDNLARTEALLRRMEENIGCVKRDMAMRSLLSKVQEAATVLDASSDPAVQDVSRRLMAAVSKMRSHYGI